MTDKFNEWILEAHRRSYDRAFETAVRTNTSLILMRDGELVEVKPPYRYELVPIEPEEQNKD